jgi:hypothetical protein
MQRSRHVSSAVCSEVHKQHTNPLCEKNVDFVYLILGIPKVTTGLKNLIFKFLKITS